MNRNIRRGACAVVCFACGSLAACTNQAWVATRKAAVIYVRAPKAPQGLAGVGGFILTSDGKVAVNGSAPDIAR